MEFRIHKKGLLRVERGWEPHRLQHLRRILAGGFLNHRIGNPVVFGSLGYIIVYSAAAIKQKLTCGHTLFVEGIFPMVS